MRVLKWDVPVDDKAHLIGHGRVVHVACQNGPDSVQVWTEEFDAVPELSRPARVYGTGHHIPVADRHLGSAIAAGGALVWHVYEVSL